MKKLKNCIKIIITLLILTIGSVAFSKIVDSWSGSLTRGMPSSSSNKITGYFPQAVGSSGVAYCDDQDAAVRWGAKDSTTYYPSASEYGAGGFMVLSNIGDGLQADANNYANKLAKIGLPSEYRNLSVSLQSISNGGTTVNPSEHNHDGFTVNAGQAIMAIRAENEDQQSAAYERAKSSITSWMSKKFAELGGEKRPQPLLEGYNYSSDYSHSTTWSEGPKVAVIGSGDTSIYSETSEWTVDSRTSSSFDEIMNAYIFNGDNIKLVSRERPSVFSAYDVQTACWLQNDHEGSHHGYNADGSGSPTLTQGTSGGYALYAEAKQFYEFNNKLKAAGSYENMISISTAESQVFVNRVDNDRNSDQYILGPMTIEYPHYNNISYVKELTLETTGENGNTTLSFNAGDFGIVTASGGQYPESGENFWVIVNASKALYPDHITIKPEFEYTPYCTSHYWRLEGSGAGSYIYMYRGYILSMTRSYVYKVTYEERGDYHPARDYWTCNIHGGEYDSEDSANDCSGRSCYNAKYIYEDGYYSWASREKTVTAGYLIIQACIKMDTTDPETDDEQEVRTVSKTGSETSAERAQVTIESTIEIKIKIAGYTWVDGTAGKESEYNGQRGDSQDKPMSGVKVILHQRKPDGSERIKATTTTNSNGYYEFDGLNALYTYYVEFRYNGQYYQPTIYKAVEWNNSSKGTDKLSDRTSFNAKFAEIGSNPKNYSGGEVYTRTYLKEKGLIDEFGNPKGSNQYVNDCMLSSFTGYNQNGTFHTEYYPVYSKFVIGDSISQANRSALVQDNLGNYIGSYNMLYNGDANGSNNLFVNQGYVLRETVDLALHKDIYNATIEIKDKSEVYKYNKNDGVSDEDFWNLQTNISDAYLSNAYKEKYASSVSNAERYYNTNDYTREVYTEDYNFKVENSYNSILNQIGMSSAEDELRVYVTYKITVRNQSDAISSNIKELVDYFDKEYTLIGSSNNVEREQKYLPYLGDRKGNFIQYVNTSNNSKYGTNTEANTGEYNKTYVTGFDNVLLDPDNQKDLYIYLTFRVNNDGNGYIILDEAVSDGQNNGYNPKRNIVEINGYTTYYTDRSIAPNANNTRTQTEYTTGNVAGLVDIDSIPGNVSPDSIPVSNRDIDTSTFEDDTSKAPNIRIKLNRENTREVNGTVFEDERTVTESNAQIGNGQRESSETGINGVTVQLVELFKDDNGNIVTDSNGNIVEKIWQEVKSGDKNDHGLIVDNTAIENIDRTSKVENSGEYKFRSFAPGYYIVRFIYGDGTESILGTNSIDYETGETIANPITNYFAEHGYRIIGTANGYNRNSDGKDIGLNENSYNGQDYKSTTYQLGVANGDSSFNDITTGSYNYDFDASATGLYSDAKDLYNRRLTVNNYSKTMTNEIAEALASFEYLSQYYNDEDRFSEQQKVQLLSDLVTKLINNTKMTAETGVMNVELEYNRQEDGNKNGNYINGDNNIGTSNYENNGFYIIKDVDFGLVQRPLSQLKTTKQIANVKVVLSNGNTLFDASGKATNVMWINQEAHKQDVNNTYTINNNYGTTDFNGSNVANNNTLIKIPAVRDYNTNKGRIQLTMDEELMYGSTIQITYIITVANVGEVDFSDQKFYYTGIEDSPNNNIVKTKLETLVDYVGTQLIDDEHITRNNLQFNAESNPDWEAVTFEELKNDGLLNANLEEDAKVYNIIIKTKDDSSVVKELVPIIWDESNARAIKDKWKNDPLNVLDVVNNTSSVTGVKLVLSQMITSNNDEDDLTYNNITEIVKTSNVLGRRNAYSVVGNQDPTQEPYEIDADTPQEVVILPPFGQNTIYYILGITVGLILIVGITVVIVVTKKRK